MDYWGGGGGKEYVGPPLKLLGGGACSPPPPPTHTHTHYAYVDKCCEKVIFKYLHNHFLDNNILTPFQLGFVPGYCTITNLHSYMMHFARLLMKGKKLGWCSVISAKLSIGYGIKNSYAN